MVHFKYGSLCQGRDVKRLRSDRISRARLPHAMSPNCAAGENVGNVAGSLRELQRKVPSPPMLGQR